MNPDEQNPDWIRFDTLADQAKELIDRLPESAFKQNASTRWAEMCYWFDQAIIDVRDPDLVVAEQEEA